MDRVRLCPQKASFTFFDRRQISVHRAAIDKLNTIEHVSNQLEMAGSELVVEFHLEHNAK